MRNVHDDEPVLFRTRWALSYLRGPLTLKEIERLESAAPPAVTAAKDATQAATTEPVAGSAGQRPLVPAGVKEQFLGPADGAAAVYQPRVGARVRAHFVDSKSGMDAWESWYYLAPLTGEHPEWEAAEIFRKEGPQLAAEPVANAGFVEPPAAALTAGSYAKWSKELEDHVYRNETLNVLHCPLLKVTAAPGGTESEFRAHIAHALREKRDAALDELRAKYDRKLRTLGDRERRAEQKVEREKAQASQHVTSSVVDIGGSLLGVLLGGRRGSAARKASAAAKSVGRASKERDDVRHAEADLEAVRKQVAQLEAELAEELRSLEGSFDPATVAVEVVEVKPRKSDLAVEDMALVWQA
jgi:hypothetical protein